MLKFFKCSIISNILSWPFSERHLPRSTPSSCTGLGWRTEAYPLLQTAAHSPEQTPWPSWWGPQTSRKHHYAELLPRQALEQNHPRLLLPDKDWVLPDLKKKKKIPSGADSMKETEKQTVKWQYRKFLRSSKQIFKGIIKRTKLLGEILFMYSQITGWDPHINLYIHHDLCLLMFQRLLVMSLNKVFLKTQMDYISQLPL